MSKPSPNFQPGQRVHHKEYQYGTIESVYGDYCQVRFGATARLLRRSCLRKLNGLEEGALYAIGYLP